MWQFCQERLCIQLPRQLHGTPARFWKQWQIQSQRELDYSVKMWVFHSIPQFQRIGVKVDLSSWQFFAKLETFLVHLVNHSLISFFFSAKVVRTSVDVEVVRDGDGRPGHHLVLVLDLLSFLCAQHHKSSGTQTTKVNYCFEKSCLFGKFYRLSKKVLKELGHCNR